VTFDAAEPQPAWMGSRRRFWLAPTALTLTELWTPYSLHLTNPQQSATPVAYGKVRKIGGNEGRLGDWCCVRKLGGHL
jgi:hypothetical protein